MLREQKTEFVNGMKDDLARAQAVLFLDFTGLTVAEADALRRKFQQANVGYKVVKNALMRRALEGTPYENAGSFLKGTPTGVAIGYEDPVATARTTYEFLKTCQHLKVKGGVVEQKSINAEQAEQLSKSPGRRELQAQIVGMALGPAGRLISQIKGPAGRIVGALDKKAEEAESAAG